MRKTVTHGAGIPVAGLVLMSVLLFGAVSSSPAGAGQSPMLSAALAGPLADSPEIVFAVRAMGRDGHWYANFGHHSRGYDSMQYGPGGGKLCKLNLRTGKLTALLEDRKGGVRDPQVHYDGRKILFSYRRGDSRYYHLYEINADGSGLRQITDGPFDEIEPIYLPNGDLMFCSSRCNRWVQCWFTQVAILYRSGPNGESIRPVSSNIEQDNTPWMTPDGRVVYMRWEYVDRSRVRYHHLWTINPDGTAVMVYFGNMYPGTVMLDAKPIPGTDKVVSIFSPGHGRKEHAGRLAVIDPDAGPDERNWVRYVGRGSNFRDPYPLSEDLFLVAENNRLLLIDSDGGTEAIHTVEGPSMMAHEPRVLRGRPREPVIPDRVDDNQPTGRMVLADVRHGRNMAGVGKGEIRKLLIMETLPKPVNFSGTMEPITHNGSFTLPRILGTVPVETDGSAYMEVPALRPLFFVALDADDMSVKRMQSFVSVMPGETTGCSGCHEHRTDSARIRPNLLATRRPPSRIEPIRDVPDVMDFPRDIQPILDKHCVKCHNYKKRPPADLPLVGDRGPWYSHSYYALMSRGYVSHGRDADGNKPPRGIGTSASRLMKQIDGSHNKVRLSPLEHEKVRLWIECGAPYPGTYAALGSGMVSVSVDVGVLDRRCAGCHGRSRGRKGDMTFKTPKDLLFNLTEPTRSPMLLAPLASQAGGWGLCKGKSSAAPRRPGAESGSVAVVFEAAGDGDYRKLLAGVEKAKESLDRATRFDMPNFRPNEHYVREMKRYGILASDADPARKLIDVYETDRAYWKSFWFRPGR
ncbi:MAG: hypothetical protein WBF17_02810 [Phycisphaerae bacterium]